MNDGSGIVTDADKELCREIARLEGWEQKFTRTYDRGDPQTGEYWTHEARRKQRGVRNHVEGPIDIYLTSASEFRRMLEALLNAGWAIEKVAGGQYCVHQREEEYSLYRDTLIIAVAQAFRDMLKAQKEAKT